MTQEKKRIKILEKRITLLSEYLETFHGRDQTKTPSFQDFIQSKGVTREMFIKDLPPQFENVPAIGYGNVYKYASALHTALQEQHNLEAMSEMSADGLQSGLIKYKSGQYGGCGCSDDKDCGQDGGNLSVSGDTHYNGAGINICVHPIAPLFSEGLDPGAWRAYRNKITEWEKCRADKKAGKGNLRNLPYRLVSLSNPALIPVRASFLKIIAYNIFGLGQFLDVMRKDTDQKSWNDFNDIWWNWGGDRSKLDSNVSIGYNKKAVFRPKGWKPKKPVLSADGGVYLNSEAATIAWIGLGSSVLGSVTGILEGYAKKKGIPPPDTSGESDPNAQGDSLTYDPNAENAANNGATPGMLDNINWKIAAPVGIALLIGIGFGIWKLTK